MENIDVIFKRGSIRKYKDKPVDDKLVKEILDAGFAAPSACNLRAYHFIVIRDRKILDALIPTSRGKIVLKNAPMAIAVCGDLNINDKYELVMNDTSACIENMLLAITSLDLGGCWLAEHRFEDETVNKILNLPQGVFVAGFIALGYPDEEKIQKDRYDEKKIHHDIW